MMRNIRIEVQKILHLPYLLLGVAGIIALCLTATGDMNVGGSQISIFSLLIRPEVTNTPHTAFELWRAGIGGWLTVFAPMLLTLGYMISLVRGKAEWSNPICADEIRKIAILYFQGLRW